MREKKQGAIERVILDVRYAFRSLAKTPGFTLTALAIVALGVGATTTIFSAVDNVLLRPLPYENPSTLVTFTKDRGSVPAPDFVDVRDRTESFETIAGVWDIDIDLTNDGTPERLDAGQITERFFSILGGMPAAGRLFTPDDFSTGAEKVAVLSYSIWQTRWGRDLGVVGRTITLNGEPTTVVGVLSPVFTSPEALINEEMDIWIPFDLMDSRYQNRRIFILSPVARLKPGVTRRSKRWTRWQRRWPRSTRSGTRTTTGTSSTSRWRNSRRQPLEISPTRCTCCSVPWVSCCSSRAPTWRICF
jgi:hypothetical protein